jgi:hypothetical protein
MFLATGAARPSATPASDDSKHRAGPHGRREACGVEGPKWRCPQNCPIPHRMRWRPGLPWRCHWTSPRYRFPRERRLAPGCSACPAVPLSKTTSASLPNVGTERLGLNAVGAAPDLEAGEEWAIPLANGTAIQGQDPPSRGPEHEDLGSGRVQGTVVSAPALR